MQKSNLSYITDVMKTGFLSHNLRLPRKENRRCLWVLAVELAPFHRGFLFSTGLLFIQ